MFFVKKIAILLLSIEKNYYICRKILTHYGK